MGEMIIYICRKEGLRPIAFFCPITRKDLIGKLKFAQPVTMSLVYLPSYGHIHSVHFNDGSIWDAVNGLNWNASSGVDIHIEDYLELYERDAKAVVAFAQQGYYRNAISAQEIQDRIRNDLAAKEKADESKS